MITPNGKQLLDAFAALDLPTNPHNEEGTVRDADWISDCFMVPLSAVPEALVPFIGYTSARASMVDTQLGGDKGFGHRPQATRYADIRDSVDNSVQERVGLSDGPRSHGLGKDYSQRVHDNEQRVVMQFGVPRFNSLSKFLSEAFDPQRVSIANTGFKRGTLFKISAMAGTVLAVLYYRKLALGMLITSAITHFTFSGSPAFYTLYPIMPIYWSAVQDILVAMAINRGALGRKLPDELAAQGMDLTKQLSPENIEYFKSVYGDMYKDNMGPNILAILGRQGLVEKWKRYMEAKDGVMYDRKGRIKEAEIPEGATGEFAKGKSADIYELIERGKQADLYLTEVKADAKSLVTSVTTLAAYGAAGVLAAKGGKTIAGFVGKAISSKLPNHGKTATALKALLGAASAAGTVVGVEAVDTAVDGAMFGADKDVKKEGGKPKISGGTAGADGVIMVDAVDDTDRLEGTDKEKYLAMVASGADPKSAVGKNEKGEDAYTPMPLTHDMMDYYTEASRHSTEFLTLLVDATGGADLSVSSGFKDNETASKINSASSAARELKFSLAGGNVGDGPLASAVEVVSGAIADVATGLLSGFTMGLANTFLGASSGANVDMPRHWASSDSSMSSISYKRTLLSPYNNHLSLIQNLDMYIAPLLAGGLPRATGNSSYTSPFVCSYYDQGRGQTTLGMISKLEVRRGITNLPFDNKGVSMGIDVSFSIQDLNNIAAMPINAGILSLPNTGVDEHSMMSSYLAVYGGLSYYDQFYLVGIAARRMAVLRYKGAQLADTATQANFIRGSTPNSINEGLSTVLSVLGVVTRDSMLNREAVNVQSNFGDLGGTEFGVGLFSLLGSDSKLNAAVAEEAKKETANPVPNEQLTPIVLNPTPVTRP
jgi:hypothetical protein